MKLDDVLVIYSDGVTEAVNALGEEFGRERLLETIVHDRGGSAEAVFACVMNAVRTFSQGAAQADDITVLAPGTEARYRRRLNGHLATSDSGTPTPRIGSGVSGSWLTAGVSLSGGHRGTGPISG